MALLLLALVLHTPPADGGTAASTLTAREENSAGMALYREGKMAEAAAHFARATDLDPRLAIAHYNLAAVLSATQQPCTEPIIPNRDFVTELEASLRLDPRRKARLAVDSDFRVTRRRVRVQRLLLPPLTNADALSQLLVNCDWSAPNQSDAGPPYEVVFKPRGEALFKGRRDEDNQWGPTRPARWWFTANAHHPPVLHLRVMHPERTVEFSGTFGEEGFTAANGERWLENLDVNGNCM